MSILFIVESPGKIKEISRILGKKYIVKATVGIFRDLDPKSLSVEIDNNFKPIYVITKKNVVKNLRPLIKKSKMVYLATDMDREGSAIAQSIIDVFHPKKYQRLLFNSITKDAIYKAISNASDIDKNHVDSQKARRVLDRLYGYLISPILSKTLKGKMSAGRVQSVATRIIVEKEAEIEKFIENNSDNSFFRVNSILSGFKFILYESDTKEFQGKVASISINENKIDKNVKIFFKKCKKSKFTIVSINNKISIRNPPPPFITSTLQQASHKNFGMSAEATMKIAQKLYENSYITYMRTDSVEISKEGHEKIKKVILEEYGKKYYSKNTYSNKSKSSQEAHECIRPINPDPKVINEIDNSIERKLYHLIWQRTIASQMKPAKINKNIIKVSISAYSDNKYYFQSEMENIQFPGFLIVYSNEIEKTPELPKLNSKLRMENIIAKQEYVTPPVRYHEASLNKKLESLKIGRPSTYASIISTILKRSYVRIQNINGIEKEIKILSMNKKFNITEKFETIYLGKEKNKLVPTETGKRVTEFLLTNFEEFMDYQFTAKMEKNLDKIAQGKKKWTDVIEQFYSKLHSRMQNISCQKKSGNN